MRHQALRLLLDLPDTHLDVVAAREAAMAAPPIRTILAAQDPAGWWEKPGHDYGKYRGTTWSLIFLDQLGADGTNHAVRRGCEYLFAHTQSAAGGFSAWGSQRTDHHRPRQRCIA